MYKGLRGASSTPLQRSIVRPAAICFSAKFLLLGSWASARTLTPRALRYGGLA